MKKTLSMVYENCYISDGYIIECCKDGTIEHNISDILEELEGEDGLQISIKKCSKVGSPTEE